MTDITTPLSDEEKSEFADFALHEWIVDVFRDAFNNIGDWTWLSADADAADVLFHNCSEGVVEYATLDVKALAKSHDCAVYDLSTHPDINDEAQDAIVRRRVVSITFEDGAVIKL